MTSQKKKSACPHVVKGFGTLEMVFFGAKGSTEGVTSSPQYSSSKKVSGLFWQRMFGLCSKKKKQEKSWKGRIGATGKMHLQSGSIFQAAMLVYRSEGANGWVEKIEACHLFGSWIL